ncbi:FtsB/FtsL family cell division protein [Tindallia californiensis]|uniref:Cell division protein FtsL n=1 Tax=Tindallia californiensis TaxID=159292 RepID=A0A1H3JQ28_9FIRM|nr:cell division protein FtsL [Tindallia californiensis]SDY42090.1 cell division protein FtsL [Tindallia californiensis]
MHAAQQLPYEYPYEIPATKEKKGKQNKKKKAEKKKYALELVVLMACLGAVLALNLFLVGRYADITSTRHAVTTLEKKTEQLQNQREQLMVEIERASRLEWVEAEAKTRLSMKYPDKDQLIYISVDPDRVNQVSQRIETHCTEEEHNGTLPQPIEKIIHKFAGILRI